MPDETSGPGEQQSSPSSNSTGLDPKVSSLLAYLLGIVGGIVFYAISKDTYVRFHSMQSILLWVAAVIIYFGLLILGFAIPFIWVTLVWLVWLGFFVLWILLMIKAYQGEKFKLPIIGQMAEKYSR